MVINVSSVLVRLSLVALLGAPACDGFVAPNEAEGAGPFESEGVFPGEDEGEAPAEVEAAMTYPNIDYCRVGAADASLPIELNGAPYQASAGPDVYDGVCSWFVVDMPVTNAYAAPSGRFLITGEPLLDLFDASRCERTRLSWRLYKKREYLPTGARNEWQLVDSGSQYGIPSFSSIDYDPPCYLTDVPGSPWSGGNLLVGTKPPPLFRDTYRVMIWAAKDGVPVGVEVSHRWWY